MPADRKALAPLCTLAVTLLAIGCNAADGSGPKLDRPASPDSTGVAFDVTAGPQNGTFSVGPATFIIKGFNHTNPRLGDAIVATFVWLGRATIDSVTDWTTTNPLTPVGNTYHLVHRVARGQVSMATYVATNVQNFAGGVTDLPGNSIYAVRADFSDTVFGGVILTSYSGVYPDWPQALDAHRAASGTDTTTVLATMPGRVHAFAGALAYAVTASNALVPLTLAPPPGLTEIAIMSDDRLKAGAWYTNWQSTSPFQPQWVWELGLSPLQRRSWVASALTLNQAPTRLAFTDAPTDARGCPKALGPRIRVTAMDDMGNPTPAFERVVTLQLKRNGLPLPPSALSGEVTTIAKNGVATFKLCVTEPAAGYTLVATSAFGDMSVESAPFTITAP